MYSAEVLSQLRSLNWLTEEFRRVPAESPEGRHLRGQLEAVRARLPTAILGHHDRLSAGGRPSAARVAAGACGACGTALPPQLLAELAPAGRFGVCPGCGVFLWSDVQAAPKPAHR
jgi:predicted  nucleic acid-binding Zn-ribbon protein